MKTGDVSVRLTLSGKPLKDGKFRCDCQMADVELPRKAIKGSGNTRFREIKNLCEWRRRWNNLTKKAQKGKMRFSTYFEKRAELLVRKPEASIEGYSETVAVKCKKCQRAYQVLVTVECSMRQNTEPSLLYLFQNLQFKEDAALNMALERVAVKSGRFDNRDHLKQFLINAHTSMSMVEERMSSLEQNLHNLVEKVSSDDAKGFLAFVAEKLKSETQRFVEDSKRTLEAYLADIAGVITQMRLNRLGVHEEIEVVAPPL